MTYQDFHLPLKPVSFCHPQNHHRRDGVLLVNLGTPESTGYWDVRRYLSEFLSDRRVIENNPLWWQPLLQGVILATRPFRSGAAYRRIWHADTGESPLRFHTREQARLLQQALPHGILVDWAMRYGRPSVAERLAALQQAGCERILVLPLYPQYSATTTATVNDAAFRAMLRTRRQPVLRTAPSFPDDPRYIQALAASVRRHVAACLQTPDIIIASYHGLPTRYVRNGDPYAEECARTTLALRQALGLTEAEMPMTFQSRFGREEWIGPATDDTVVALARKGAKRIAVICPGFFSDCIETLDEIGHELRELFLEEGGEDLTLVPGLNSSPEAIAILQNIVTRELARS